MITAASLKSRTSKDLAQMAKKKGVSGWHSMRKDDLVKALVRLARQNANKKNSIKKAPASAAKSAKSRAAVKKAGVKRATVASTATKSPTRRQTNGASKKPPQPATEPRVVRKIRREQLNRERQKDLSLVAKVNGNGKASVKVKLAPGKDRVVLLVRDSYWLHAYWEITRQTIDRAQIALAEHWHTAKPTLRLIEIEDNSTSSISERVVRDIEVHGGVKNWYIDVVDPPKQYRVSLGYKAANGRFHCLVRSNAVETPRPGSSDAIDRNWTDIAEDSERVFAMSGGYGADQFDGELREIFEEQLRRPMGSPADTQYGIGAEGTLERKSGFGFSVDAEMIVYGSTRPNAYVTLAGEPVKLRQDGTFTVRISLPDRRQVLPVVASSSDGVEQRTTVLAIERNTKVLEPITRETNV